MTIAVIGSGVSGLVAAYLLSRKHRVEVFEADTRPGGHVNTVKVDDPQAGTVAVDTGFIVHNRPNYPNLTRVFDELGITTQASNMSFAVESPEDGFAYQAGHLLSQRHVMKSAAGLKLISEIVRFLFVGRTDLHRGTVGAVSIAEYARGRGFSERFIDLYAVPMAAALWSMPPGGAAEIPAEFVLRFFDNHSLLGLRRHRWRTVTGGARRYVDALIERLPGPVHLGTPISRVRRNTGSVTLTTPAGERSFDSVVIATHGDQALRLLADPDQLEHDTLGAFRTTPNRATLHFDETLLPPHRSSWASWNVRARQENSGPVVTYFMNSLQKLQTARPYCVTLNSDALINPDKVLRRIDYRHPVFDTNTIEAQRLVPQLNGRRRTYYCGAYQGWGFHEDGATSAVRVAEELGVRW